MDTIERLREVYEAHKGDTDGSFRNALWQVMVNGEEAGIDPTAVTFTELLSGSNGSHHIVIASASGGYFQGCQFDYSGKDVQSFLSDINRAAFHHGQEVSEHIEILSYRNNS